MTLRTASLTGIGIAFFIILLTIPFVWLPDLFTNGPIVLGEMKTSEGDYFRVTQKFVGDGYLTLFDHTNKAGQSWHAVFDGDAGKGWRAKFERTNNTIIVHALHQSFFYNLDTHSMMNEKGTQRAVLPTPTSQPVASTNGSPTLTHE